jgi:hypothetical protein
VRGRPSEPPLKPLKQKPLLHLLRQKLKRQQLMLLKRQLQTLNFLSLADSNIAKAEI